MSRENASQSNLDLMSLRKKITMERDVRNGNVAKGQSIHFVINRCGLSENNENDQSIIQDKMNKAMNLIKSLDNGEDSK